MTDKNINSIGQNTNIENKQDSKKKLSKLKNTVAAGVLVALTAGQPAISKAAEIPKVDLSEVELSEEEAKLIAELMAPLDKKLAASTKRLEESEKRLKESEKRLAESTERLRKSTIEANFSVLMSKTISCLNPGNKFGLNVSDTHKYVSKVSIFVSDQQNLDELLSLMAKEERPKRIRSETLTTMLADSRVSNQDKQTIRTIQKKLQFIN